MTNQTTVQFNRKCEWNTIYKTHVVYYARHVQLQYSQDSYVYSKQDTYRENQDSYINKLPYIVDIKFLPTILLCESDINFSLSIYI